MVNKHDPPRTGLTSRIPALGPSGALRASKSASCRFVEHRVAGSRSGRDAEIKNSGGQRPPEFFIDGGVDGTRTRDPRRDRPVF